MTTLVTAAIGLGGLAAYAVAGAKWARVVQREHYLPGSAGRIARLWLRARPVNRTILVVTVVAVIVALFIAVIGTDLAGSTDRSIAAIATVVIVVGTVLFPWRLAWRGRDRALVWTRRLIVLAVITVVVSIVLGLVLVALGVPWWSATAILAAALPLVAELAMRLALPLEDRVAGRFQRQAEARLRRVAPTTIAVTGSWGKTTTKNHIRQLAAPHLAVAMSPASFNNRGGLSRTMNEHLPDGTELLAVEMGMYGPGEIRAMCDWVAPDIGVIVAIGPMHLERVGSIEGIVAAKSEIVERTSTAVLWVDTPELESLSQRLTGQRVIRCGSSEDCEVRVVTSDDRVGVEVAGVEIGVIEPSSGLHPANVACAIGALIAAGLTPDQLQRSFGEMAAPDHRATMTIGETGIVTIDDTFNSNPRGAAHALELLSATGASQRFVVTPGMMEIGHLQDTENRAFARAAASSGAVVVVVGATNRRALVAGVVEAGGHPVTVDSREDARRLLRERCHPGDAVLWENDLPDHYP